MNKRFFLCLIFSLTFFTAGCGSFKKIVVPPHIKLEEVRIDKLSAMSADLEVVLEVKNVNRVDFDVKNLKYSLDINDKTVTTGKLTEKVVVKAKETTFVSLPIKILYKDIFSSALMFLQKDGLPYRIQGSAEVGPFTIPFDDKGNLKSTDL